MIRMVDASSRQAAPSVDQKIFGRSHDSAVRLGERNSHVVDVPLSRCTTTPYVQVSGVRLLLLEVVGGGAGSVAARSMIRLAIGQRSKDAGIRAVDRTISSECG